MINFHTKTVRQGINKAYLKVAIKRADLDAFKEKATIYLNNLEQAEGESEEHFKGYLKDFLQNTFYSNAEKLVNTSDRIDLAIYSGKSTSSSVDVIIEAKRPGNKAEMISKEKLNQKALQEALHYYFDEREKGNDSIKQVVITNYTEFFIFDAQEIERLFYSKKKLVKAYQEWKNDGKVSGKTEFIYNKFEEFIKSSEGTLTGIYADLNSYKKQLSAKVDEETDKKLIPLFKLFSPEHLTKKSFANDSNSLDTGFYYELLHILGFQQVNIGSKRLIQRLPEADRNPGSLVENTIATLKYDQHMNEVRDAKIQYGDGEDDQLFGVALELVITWMNRVLFLKLLEAQLLAYHQLDPKFKFLVFEGIIDEYDELNKLFFRVLALKNNERPESLKKRFGHIPYLNSSLFDSTNLEKATIQISGLDDKASIPIYNKSVFRKSANPPKGSLNTLEYLLRFLDAYNFSAESSGGIQTEDKALINASVLGLIFEKINGYKDGSFFTPGFITEYMARETLRKSVVDKLNEAFDWDCKSFDELHRKVENQSLEEVNAVINSITICDPAVGSGHFLVSCLNELLAIKAELKVLCDVEGKRIPYLDIEVENDELAIEHNGELFEYKVNHEWKSEIVERSHAGKERQRIQQALFHEKRFLIEHCLFGVDINPNSVKICRLRLWIELLKHAYYKSEQSHPDPEDSGDGSAESGTSYTPYSELEVLPNIDINIKQGNSLVSRFGLDEDLTAIFKKSEHSLEDYKQAVKNYRETRDRNEKQRLQKLIDDIKAEYSETLLNNKPINKKLSKERGKLELMQNEDLFGGGKATKKELTAQQKKVTKLEEQKAEEEAGAFYREAFEWRFEFPEVLDDTGNYRGFDVVIANPPYGSYLNSDDKIYLKNHYNSVERNYDVYPAFVELGNNLNRVHTYSSFIIPISWLTGRNYKSFRETICNKKKIEKSIILPYDVFNDAYIDTCITFFQKNLLDSYKSEVYEFNPRDKIGGEDLNEIQFKLLPKSFWSSKDLLELVFDPKFYELEIKSTLNSIPLENISDTARGILSSKEDIYQEKQKGSRPYFVGDVYRYILKEDFQWVKYGDNLKEKPRDFYYFEGKRILVRRLISRQFRMMGVIAESDFVNKKDIYNVIIQDNKYAIEYLLALINSRFFSYLKIGGSSLATKDDFSQLTLGDLRKLPIKIIPPERQIKFVELANQILALKKENSEADTSKLEAEIDQMVYELYGLTEEEIAIVEESVG
ncbi:MAG: Eco57I restriction-modification methylase domain-containing protein [Balneola sp.]